MTEFDSIPEAIRRTIEKRIADEGLEPGHRLGLKSELQDDFGVAGPTIDQALKLLANDGLVSVRRGPGGGVFVARSQPVLRLGTKQLWASDPRSLSENIEMREALASLLGVSAARNASRHPDLVERLRELAAELEQAPIEFSTQGIIWDGHEILTEMCDNATLALIYGDLLSAARSLIVSVDFPTEGPEASRETRRIDAHVNLFRAVADGDVEAAQEFGQLVRVVSPLGRDGQRVTVKDGLDEVEVEVDF